MSIVREVAIDVKPTVKELAEEVAHLSDYEQAQFFELVAKRMASWDAGYRDKQLIWIAMAIRGELKKCDACPGAACWVQDLAEFIRGDSPPGQGDGDGK